MSEFTHFFVEEILEVHRGDISYEDIYLTVLEIVEKPKNLRDDGDDQYGICINSLFKDIDLRDRIDMYWLFGNILKYNISVQSNITMKIDTFSLVVDHFETYHPSLPIDYEDHPIHRVLEDPYLKIPFEVKVAGISNGKEDVLNELYNEYNEYNDYLDTLDENEIIKIIIKDLIMPNPEAFFGTGDEDFEEFMLVKDTEHSIPFIKKLFHTPRLFLLGNYMLLKEEEIRNQISKCN